MKKSVLDCEPCSEHFRKSENRGCLQQPNTDSEVRNLKQIKKVRILTVKLNPDSDQWKRLRELSFQATHYRNCQMRAKWAEAIGLRIDPDKGDKHDLSKFIRKMEKGELSGAVYSAAEREVQGVWQRDGKKIMAGLPWSQWSQNNSLSVRDDGIRLFKENGKYILSLAVQNKDCDGGCWMAIPLSNGTEVDKFLSPILDGMTEEKIKALKCVLIFKPNKGKTLARIAYELPMMVPPMGERVATISNINGRFLLRCELATIDYTSKLTIFIKRKQNWDLIRRRVSCQIGKRKGHARAKRKVFDRIHFDDWAKTHLHQWTAHIIKWCISHGVGQITLLDLAGGDWPAHLFEQFITYKAQDSGLEVVKGASLDDPSTDRAVGAEIKKARRKSKKLGDAARTLNAALS